MLSDEQRARLRRAQLGALVRDLTGASPEVVSLGTNAAAIDGATAYLLSEVADPASLAGALAWTLRQGAAELVLFTDDLGGDVARMAGWFAVPVQVRSVQGAGSVPVPPAPFPERLDVPDPSDGAVADLFTALTDAGLEVVVEDGVVRGEVLGLEVARLVTWPVESGGDGELHLEAGVGRFDRDAVAAMHHSEPPTTTLARSVEMVRRERVPGAGTHPLSRLGRERWLRCSILDDPALLGATRLQPTETTVRRDSVRDASPAAAVGVDAAGEPVVVVCSTGADLAFVPVAADTRAWVDPSARLVLAVPERDRIPTLDRLAAALVSPAEVVAVPAPWEQS